MSEIAIINFQSSNASVIDLQNHVTLGSYKNSSAKRNNVTLLKDELLLIGDSAKALLHTFHLKKWEEELSCKIVLPAKPNAVAASRDGCFVAIAMGSDVMVWQPAMNLFVKCPKTHYQQVTIVRFTKEGSHFITAGDDGMIVLWHLTKVLSNDEQLMKTCSHVFSDHQLPITDINVSADFYESSLISTSMDRTCRIYDLNSKATLLKIVFESVMCVAIFSDTKHCAFLGDTNGNIFKVILTNFKPYTNEVFENQMKDLNKFAPVHKKEITSLAMMACNLRLVSGSSDKLVVIWNSEGQALKVLQQTSEVTNITVMFASCLEYDKEGCLENTIKTMNRVKCDLSNPNMELQCPRQFGYYDFFIKEEVTPASSSYDNKLEEENLKLKKANAELFEYCKLLLDMKNDKSEDK
ncbi:WD repeat-containing protein 18 [Culicoides brevitarsis]|uniref:WD repeat-containing protein 18 n=1 Tax=Culicoides brevitarsis TaxID=469753 RepID=UPI00307CBEA5